MTEEEFISQKRDTFKPVALMDKASQASVTNEQDLDLRIGEPTFFYVLLENPNNNLRSRRKYSL